MDKLTLITSLLVTLLINGQETKRKFRPLLWTQHELNTDVAGVSIGFYPEDLRSDNHLNKTFGVRIEAFPLSFLYFLAPRVPEIPEVSHKIYGINISTGTFEGLDIHGISAIGFMNNIQNMNGISVAGLSNSIENANGIIIGLGGNGVQKGYGIMVAGPYGNFLDDFKRIQISFENESNHFTGIQIGLCNKTNSSKGIQLGLWNKNEKRSFPIVNWNF